MITITGLTAHQVSLLDTMWNLAQLEDVQAWRATLDHDNQQQVDLLMQMVVVAAMDDIVGDDTAEAAEYLQRFRL